MCYLNCPTYCFDSHGGNIMKKFFAKLFGKKAKPVAKPADVKPAAPVAAPKPVK